MNTSDRFSDRVEDYVRYRPSYPEAVFASIDRHVAERFSPTASFARVAADMGSGTGLFTAGLLARGWTVHAVEPSTNMRAAAEHSLAEQAGFISHGATAEVTGLSESCVSLVTAAQAFHWFDPVRCHAEWKRILMPRGLVCLLWNARLLETPFMQDYEAMLLTFLPDYAHLSHRRIDEAFLRRFLTAGSTIEHFPNHQSCDWEHLLGRFLSSSYVPKPGTPLHEPIVTELKRLFDQHQVAGQIDFAYNTEMAIGSL
ncbi:MAG TPA: class I SAM-dependent methyltransferase [Polyangiaceae bacterium]|nr:class I SAM-dependent methyltransferase [Polyangiaceae bacterium]